MIDLSSMKGIRVDPARRTVRAEACLKLTVSQSGVHPTIGRPFPPRPLAWLTLCHCDVLLDTDTKSGHF
jgi:hypothetical protein